MKAWLVKTNDIDYDLYQSAVVIAATRLEAEHLAWVRLTNNKQVKNYYGSKFEQNWHAQEISLDNEHIVLADFKAG